MPRLIQANEADAERRKVFFDLRSSDGITPVNSEAGGQPQLTYSGKTTPGGLTDGFTSSGISTLTLIGNGRYYATLDLASVATVGLHIETRYKSANTADMPGDTIEVVDYDPFDAVSGVWETAEGQGVISHTNKITTAFLTALSPVGRKALEIVQGDSYIAAEGRALDFPVPEGANWPTDLTGYTITFKATKTDENLNDGDTTQSKVGSIVTATGDNQKVRVEFLATDTDGLAVGVGTKGYRYQIVATLTGGHEATLIKGLMTVLEKD